MLTLNLANANRFPLWLLTLGLSSLLVSSTASAEVSIFNQPTEQILQTGAFQCSELEIGKRIAGLQNRCGDSIDQWKKFALSLIHVPTQHPIDDGFQTRELQTVVYRNTLITEAYAHLYLMSQASFPACSGHSPLPWVGGASLGSLKSGQVMRSGLSVYVDGIEEFDRYEDADYRKRFSKLFGPIISRIALENATLTLGEGNLAIFTDLYWQLLAGATCGPEEVIRTIENDPRGKTDAKLLRSLRSWKLLAEAQADCDPDKIIRANKGFVEVEQYLVGQEVMYEGITKSVGGKILSRIVEPAVPAALGTFPDFYVHAKKKTPKWLVSFANADQRVSWMQDQLGVMEDEFRAKNWLMKPLFCAVTADSTATRSFLDSAHN